VDVGQTDVISICPFGLLLLIEFMCLELWRRRF